MSLYRPRRGGRPIVPLLLGDLIIFIAFAFFGRAEHRMDLDVVGTLTTAAPFAIVWLVIGAFYGVYSSQMLSPGTAAKRTMIAWLFAGPWALLIRAIILQRPVIVSFAIITISVIFVALTLWRVVYAWIRG